MQGKVTLVGTGPGNPDLFPSGGVRALAESHLILHDGTVPDEIFPLIPPGVAVMQVPPGEVSTILDQKGKNLKVTYLTGLDPWYSTMEIPRALMNADVSFEIIPGPLPHTVFPVYSGLSLFGRTGAVTLVTILKNDELLRRIPWDVIGKLDTLVFYTLPSHLRTILSTLGEWCPPESPCFVIRAPRNGGQETLSATISSLNVQDHGDSPCLLIVKKDQGESGRVTWSESRPLFGKRVLVTREKEQAQKLATLLQELGAIPISIPLLKILPPENPGPLQQAIQEISSYDWLIFSSVNGVKSFFSHLFSFGEDVRALRGVRIGAIGPATKDAILEYSITVNFSPEEYTQEGVVEYFQKEEVGGRKFLLPRADRGRELLPQALQEMGGIVRQVVAYRSVPDYSQADRLAGIFQERKVHAVTFTSSSMVRNFVEILRISPQDLRELLRNVMVACIGPVTRETAESLGITVDCMPRTYTMEGLAQELAGCFRRIKADGGERLEEKEL